MRIAVVEDERPEREKLLAYVRRYFGAEQPEVFAFSNGKELLGAYPERLDILILDIQMKPINGLEAAKAVRAFDGRVVILFATNLVQYALRGYEVEALDFMIKPIRYSAFEKRMDRALARLDQSRAVLVEFKSRKDTCFLNAREILYCESSNKCTMLHTKNGEIWCSESLAQVEEKLPVRNFFRCHRSFIVNLECIDSLSPETVRIGNAEIPVSKYRRIEFMTTMTNFIGGKL